MTNPAGHALDLPDHAIAFLGDELTAGVGDPKAQGWVVRVLGRTNPPEGRIAGYNLGVPGATSSEIVERLRSEVPARFVGSKRQGVVISVGWADARANISIARHRLNLANILDEAHADGVESFVVGPPPSATPLDDRLRDLSQAQAEVCDRRKVTYVDCFGALVGHDQWLMDVTNPAGGGYPGQVGYGLIAWLVLYHGWTDWAAVSPPSS